MKPTLKATLLVLIALLTSALVVACGGRSVPEIIPPEQPLVVTEVVQVVVDQNGNIVDMDAQGSGQAAEGLIESPSEESAQPETAQDTSAETAAAQPTQQTLTVSFPGDTRSDIVNQIIDSFIAKKAAEGVLVTIETNEPTDAYLDQVLLDFSAGIGPDVFTVGADGIPEFAESQYLLPLDDRVASWPEWQNFPSGMQEMTVYNGQTYGVMYDTDTRLIYYRTDVFEAAGLPVPWTPFTWDDVLGAAAQIRDTGAAPIPMEIQSGTVWGEATTVGGVLMLLHGAGGQLLDPADGKWVIESPALLQSFEFYERVFGENLSPAEPFMEPEPWVPFLQEGFRDGDVGFIVSGSWMWGLYAPTSEWAPILDRDDVVGWAPMPARELGAAIGGRDKIGLGGGWGWSIASTTDTPDLAWEFVQFMTSADSVTRYVNVLGSIPARSDAVSDEEFMTALATEVLPYQTFRPSHPDYNRVSAEVQLATERIMLGQADAAEAMRLFGQAVENMLGADAVKRIPSQ